MANETTRGVINSWLESGAINYSGSCIVGDNGGDDSKGALRFTNLNVDINTTFNLCELVYKYSSVGGSGTWKFKVRAINEDNTAAFGYPFGRALTTANVTYSESQPTSGGTKTMNVSSQVQEVVARSGWSNGNAIGFVLEDNGSDDNVFAFASIVDTYLVFRTSAEPNFKPTIVTVSAPTIPTAENYGLKFSSPGISVLTATEEQTTITTGKKQFKVHMEGEVSATGASITVAHGLVYVPFVMLFIKFNSLTVWEKMPSSGFKSYYVNSTNLVIPNLVSGDKVYYYIFLDELNT